jgi:pimeloyl-ACP methyl ester carboxylesterase
MPITADVAALRSGINLPYAEHGDPGGVPVVLLHGLSDSHLCWERILAELPDSIHAYAVTARGHGDASRPGSYTVDDMAQDTVEFMDAVGLRSAIVVGHSMGSIVATRVAIDHPDRVAGLVILGAAARFITDELEEMAAELDAMSGPVGRDYLRDFQLSTLARPIPPAVLDAAVDESAKLSIATLRAALRDVCLVDFSGEIGAISAPTLIAWGEHDAICSREQQDALLAGIPDARLSVQEGGGHAFHWEDPARFAAELSAFAEATWR